MSARGEIFAVPGSEVNFATSSSRIQQEIKTKMSQEQNKAFEQLYPLRMYELGEVCKNQSVALLCD